MSTAVESGAVARDDPATPRPPDPCECCLRGPDQEALRSWLFDIARQVDSDEWGGAVVGRQGRTGAAAPGTARRANGEVFEFRHEEEEDYMDRYRRQKAKRSVAERRQAEEDVQRMVEEMKSKLESVSQSSIKCADEVRYFQVLAPNESPLVVQGLAPSSRRPSPREGKTSGGKATGRTDDAEVEWSVSTCTKTSASSHQLKPNLSPRGGSQPVFSHFAECVQRSRRARSSSSAVSSIMRAGLRLATAPRSADLEASLHLVWPSSSSIVPRSPPRSHTTLGMADRRPQTQSMTNFGPHGDCRHKLALPRISRALRRSFQTAGERASTAGPSRPSLRREPLCVVGPSKLRAQRQCPRSAGSVPNPRMDDE